MPSLRLQCSLSQGDLHWLNTPSTVRDWRPHLWSLNSIFVGTMIFAQARPILISKAEASDLKLVIPKLSGVDIQGAGTQARIDPLALDDISHDRQPL